MSIKSTIAALAASPFLFAGAAFAGPYVNLESNLGYPNGDYSTATTDLHIGYEGGDGKVGYYAQVGPGFVHTESGDTTETEISGKAGITYAATDSLGVYGEIAGITNEVTTGSTTDDQVNWTAKLGAKFVF